jgi:60 kDa SS-A/Ro ribonucleoprotein
MANRSLFQSIRGALLPRTDVRNEAGGMAYRMNAQEALAQLACTGCFNQSFYASAEDQLKEVLVLLPQVDNRFIAQTAIHARKTAAMKDMPALLMAWLAIHDGELGERVFGRVIDNGKLLRNFVQMLRSGVLGRKSLGSRPKRWVQRWLESASDAQLLSASVGQQPSLADVVKMVHPRAGSKVRNAFYGWLIGREHDAALLPTAVKALDAFRADASKPVPEVPFQLLTATELSTAHWTAIAKGMSWQALRMNLNSLLRHGVFEDSKMVQTVAQRLVDSTAISKTKAQPYQLLSAWRMVGSQMPVRIVAALEEAMELATGNVPRLPGSVAVCVDVSGSMQSAITGYRPGATSAVSCLDVAALFGAAIHRRNPDCVVIPFAEVPKPVRLDPHQRIAQQAQVLVKLGGGGTAISSALAWLNKQGQHPDTVIVISDNQSWADSINGASQTMREFAKIKANNAQAKLVCIDLQPYTHSQAPNRPDVLNVGGFSDAVFDVINQFVAFGGNGRHWVDVIGKIEV